MRGCHPVCRAAAHSMRSGSATILLVLMMLCGTALTAHAQLSGTQTIGGSGSSYPTIEAAISALNANGVSGPVTFLIASGTYSAPGSGYVMQAVKGMSATNTVTFRPASGATVNIIGTINTPVFDFNGSSYFIIDGSNTVGGSSRNWTASNTGNGSVVRFINGATYNTVRNMNLMNNSTSSTYALVNITAGTGANSYNLVSSNTLGDTGKTFRNVYNVFMGGATATPNVGNTIDNNDIVNFGAGTSVGYGIYVSTNNQEVKILRNRISCPVKYSTTTTNYGIFWSNTDNRNDTIAYNRIWDIAPNIVSNSHYGIYFSSIGSLPMTVHNNMISLIGDQGTIYGIYIGTSVNSTYYLYYNSVHIGGNYSGGATTSRCLYFSSTQSATLRNNVLSNERISTGTGTNHAIYRATNAAGVFNSNYNVFWAAGNSTAVGYWGGNQTGLTNWRNASGQDANSLYGQPGFVDVVAGNLHIGATRRTVVEGRGTTVAGVTKDLDGATRNGATPDIGADEGTFGVLLTDDMGSVSFQQPLPGARVAANTAFTPTAIIYNNGTIDRTSIPVRFRIWSNATGSVVYNDVQTISSIGTLASQALSFNQNGSVTGSTSLGAGTYTIEVRTESTGDGDTTNNAIYSTIIVRGPLAGTYTINPSGSGSTNYTSFTSAVADLNAFGVSSAVTFLVSSGTYDESRETFPLVLTAAPGMSSSNTVTFRPASGANVVLDGGGGDAIIDMNSGDYYTLDGSNTVNGSTRNWKVINRIPGPAIRFINGATYNTVRNMNLMVNSQLYSAVTGAPIYFSTTTSSTLGGNSYNLVQRNTIGDSSGIIRNYAGVYLSGTSTGPNLSNLIDDNDIINFSVYGVYVSSYNQQVNISRNRITQPTKNTTLTTIYGIYWTTTTGGTDTIAYNRIWDIGSNATSMTQNGIYFSALSTTPVTVHNNMISMVADVGTLYGIYVGTSTSTAMLNLYYNSIHIGGGTGSVASRNIYFSSTTTTPITDIRNNILSNERVSTSANSNYLIYRSNSASETSDAITSNNNVFWNYGTGTTAGYNKATNYATLAAWQSGVSKDANSVFGRPWFVDPVTGDLHLRSGARTVAEGRAATGTGITTDVDGTTRSTTAPDAGADEGTFAAVLAADMSSLGIVTPLSGTLVPAATTFVPSATVFNNGTASASSIPVRFRIWNNSTGAAVYNDLKTVSSLASLTQSSVTFGTTGSVSGSTSLAAGTYTIEVRTELATDGDTVNNAVYGTITVLGPLAGAYTIDPNGSGSRNYPTFTAAVADLRGRGVSAAVTFDIADGIYDIQREVFPLQITAAPGLSAANTVTFRPAAGANVLLSAMSNTLPLFDIDGGDYIIFEGSNNGSTSRNWTLRNEGTGAVLRFINGATNNVVRNMKLQGTSTATTGALVYIGTSTSALGGNSNNSFVANEVGDAAGIYRSTYNFYLAGTSGATNRGTIINNNDILNFGPESSTGYGIYVSTINDQIKITRNRITQSSTPLSQPRYGIYWTNGNSLTDTIANNRIWGMNSVASNAQYGIYINSTSSSPLAIFNNMIALKDNGNQTLGGIYYVPAQPAYIYHNAVYIGGGTPSTAASTSYAFYNGSTGALTLRNNIFVNERQSLGTNTNRVFHNNSASANPSSNYNLYYASGASTTFGFKGSTNYPTLADWNAATGLDANSVSGNPRFVDPDIGDLHISTTLRTPVEGRGTPITGMTLDVDGDTRSATQPDLGADEGTFLGLFANDMAADRFVSPNPDIIGFPGVVAPNTAFTPTAIVSNRGLNSQTGVSVTYTIRDAATNGIVYQDVATTGTLVEGQMAQISFGMSGSVIGSTSLPEGDYRLELAVTLNPDENSANNAISGIIKVRGALSGVYTINRNGTGVRNFVSFTEAVTTMGQLGVGGAVTFEVAAGTYDNVNESFPIRLTAVSGISMSNNVTFRPAAGATVVLDINAGSTYVFDIDGGDYYTFNGANTSTGATRNWTIINQSNGGVFRFINGATNNVVRNMKLMTNGTSTTLSPIYFATSSAANGGNSSNLITSNTIGDDDGNIWPVAGVYMAGSSAAPNTDNMIDNNDIVNFGTPTGYGVYVNTYNDMVKIVRNRITQSVPGASGTKYGIYWSNSTSVATDSIAYNRIWQLGTTVPTSTQYGVYISSQAALPLVLHNNMIAMVADQGTIYGVYTAQTGPLYLDHNTIYAGGSYSSGSTTSYLYYNGGSSVGTYMRDNVFVNERVSTGSNTNRGIYMVNTPTTMISDYNVMYTNGTSTVPYYYAGTYSTNLAGWQSSTGQDANSVSAAVPFVNRMNGDLHIDPQPIFRGEGVGTNLGYLTDFDGENRTLYAVDMGADDGDFNGDGLRIVNPNGGEKVPADYDATIRFTANRIMAARVDLSTDNGVTWTTGPTIQTVVGMNAVTLHTPDIETTQALVRAVNGRNQYEFDRSDNTFELVRPTFTIVTPNGGERLVPTDTTRIQWTSQYVPSDLKVTVEYSINGGTSWLPIAANLQTANLPATNTIDWVVPNTPTTQALVRVRIPGSAPFDVSDNLFTITPPPVVTLVKPNGGEKFFVGDRKTIEWTVEATDYVKLEYSTDAGLSWTTILNRVPAYNGRYDWTVPNVPTSNALVRVTNNERPRFSDQSDNVFSILKDQITVTAPNGGEKYEMNDPVTVRWNALSVATVRVDYSINNGLTWTTVAPTLPATDGSFTFTPQAVLTKVALVRVVNTEREATQDRSDKVFEILDAKSITILSPGAGDEYVRGSSTVITWNAPRVTSVSIQYSSNGGSSWTTVVSNVQASLGSYVWTVPSALTKQGIIRITEVGGSIVAESGMFSIVDQTVTTVRVISPNGGESYTEGEAVVIRWTATSDLTTVGLSYSSDGGTTWKVITPNATASSSQYSWVAPSVTGTEYRVKVEGGTASDISDGNFEVVRKPQPKITVLSPNGGEKLTIGQEVTVSWSVQDIGGMVLVGYSTNKGATWSPISTAQATAGSISWTVPQEPTAEALVAVASLDVAGVADTSNGTFTIEEKQVLPLVLTSPNGGEVWVEKEKRQITWNAPDDITQVEMHYSTDGGQNWKFIAGSASVSGANSYEWTVEQASTTEALVRVRSTTDITRQDISDAVFTINYSPLSVPGAVIAGRSALNVLGNYPNPFAATTELRWVQGVSGQTSLRMFDGGGRVVRTVEIGRMETGEHQLTIEAGELPSGTYHYELRVGGTTAHGVMMILR